MNGNGGQKLAVLEKISFKLTEWLGTPLSLIIHTLIFAAVSFFAIFADLAWTSLIILAIAISLEAIYLSLFNHIAINRNIKALSEANSDIAKIMEEQKQSHQLMINILHFAHQMKTLQKDLDALKKSGILKRANGNGHRVQA